MIIALLNIVFNTSLIIASLIPHRLDLYNYNKNGKYCEIDYNELRKEAVKEAFVHTWKGYKKFAWGKDELKPLTNSSNERFQNWGATLVDSLTTLWLMDLKEEFQEAIDEVEKIDFTKSNGKVNFFETTIRYLGGLIGGYDLSGNKVLLNQAIKLADSLLIAFDSPTGYPFIEIIFPDTIPDKSKRFVLAEIGTCQLEFTRLSQITGNSKYERKSMAVFDKLDKLIKPTKGLYPVHLHSETGKFDTKEVSFGSLGDSFYEYLIKVYMLTGKKDTQMKRMYLECVEGFKTLIHPREDGLQYFKRIGVYGYEEEIMDHLSLFMGGLLQYGDFVLNSKEDSKLGLSLTHMGYKIYNSTATKLGPESLADLLMVAFESPSGLPYPIVNFEGNDKENYRAPEIVKFSNNGPISVINSSNYLRPELLESFFYSWRYTKDPKYRDRAWEIFEAFNKYSRTSSGFSSYLNVQSKKSKHQHANRMESFFLAETLKYLYLIFSEDSILDLNEFVLNTEAHPFKLNSIKK
ncbi:glycoside hydrolase family 47 protein [Conidiobolus coronatus NRRL 28638]|uniref:alpha-1,2-Mannosidase n=1 Tax=Conidiobolus coronatus (strain ATCC 28846 / CBS 209.66 / NRRL 28638) TaxID=796925 RepID=A0A137P916_CONC2|nr:glycoside hydrolase family 47 protein [Conidiobolus coronatus NRRL 28638]|eukprot:KXN71495.1 glycoside hydrolase family 47 protein [Conidiobolus coronatus NRRL 28638]